jgi:excisionase family DNA binding protein
MAVLMRIERLAYRLNVSVSAVRLWVSQDRIPYYRASRLLLFNEEEVLAALKHHAERHPGEAGSPTQEVLDATNMM